MLSWRTSWTSTRRPRQATLVVPPALRCRLRKACSMPRNCRRLRRPRGAAQLVKQGPPAPFDLTEEAGGSELVRAPSYDAAKRRLQRCLGLAR